MIESLILNTFTEYVHIFIWFSEWGGGPTFVTGPGSVSPLSALVGYIKFLLPSSQ
jgi:hypothetical protein